MAINCQMECTQDDVAAALGITGSYAGYLEKRALEKLRAYLSERGIGAGDL